MGMASWLAGMPCTMLTMRGVVQDITSPVSWDSQTLLMSSTLLTGVGREVDAIVHQQVLHSSEIAMLEPSLT